jgi:hypothetical protein
MFNLFYIYFVLNYFIFRLGELIFYQVELKIYVSGIRNIILGGSLNLSVFINFLLFTFY